MEQTVVDKLATVTSPMVGVLVRVVPDGFVVRDGKGYHRVSLVLAPDVRPYPRGKTFPLHEWPTRVGELIKKIRIHASVPVGAYPVTHRDLDENALLGAEALLDATQRGKAQRLWLEIFGADADGEDKGFLKLYAMLQEEQGVKADARLKSQTYQPPGTVVGPSRRAKTTKDALNKIDAMNVYSYPVADAAAIIEYLRFAEILLHVVRNWDRFNAQTRVGASFRGLLGPRFWAADDSRASGLRWRLSSLMDTTTNVANWPALPVAKYFAKAFDAGGFAPFKEGTGGIGRLSQPRAPLRTEIQQVLGGGGRWSAGVVAKDRSRNSAIIAQSQRWQINAAARKDGNAVVFDAGLATTTGDQGGLEFLRVAELNGWKPALAPFFASDFLANGKSDDPQPAPTVNMATVMQSLSEVLVRSEITWLADRVETQLSEIKSANKLDDDIRDDPLDPVRRKFHGVMEHSNLARFLGLVVDVTLDDTTANALIGKSPAGDTSTFGELAADIWGGDVIPSTDPLIWTAFKRSLKKPDFFGPATNNEWLWGLDEGYDQNGNPIPTAMPYRNGLLDLSARMGGTKVNRYELVSLDVTAALNAFKSRAQSEAGAYERGTLQSDLASTFPECRTRGIALIDRARADDVVREIANASANEASAAAASAKDAKFKDRLVLKAEDLTIGCRIDIGLASKKSSVADAYWGSITARDVEYRDSRIPKAVRRVPDAFRSREDTSVRPATKEHMADQKDDEAVARAQPMTKAGDFTINGAYSNNASNAVAKFDDQYLVKIVANGNNSNISFKVFGTDSSGNAIDDTVAGNNGNPVQTNKAFKTVTRVTASGAVAGGDVTIGIDGIGATVMAHEMICTWTGESLAVPPTRGAVVLNPLKQLAVEMCYDLPAPPAADVMPPLRSGHGYFAGARLVYINQGGLSLEEAQDRYRDETNPVVIGDVAKTTAGKAPAPYMFAPHEKIARPDLLLPVNDPLVTAYGKNGSAGFPGDQIDVLIVRSGKTLQRKVVRRFVTPAGVSFDFAEQFGMFDADSVDPALNGAMTDVHLCLRGAYPVATDTGPRCPVPTKDGAAAPHPDTNVRGPYLEFHAGTHTGGACIYPNPIARFARLALADGDVQRPSVMPIAVPFWEDKQNPWNARPLLVSVQGIEKWKPGDATAQFDSSTEFPLEQVSGMGSATPGTARHVRVSLAPAEEVTLQIWSEPDNNDLVNRTWFGQKWVDFMVSAQAAGDAKSAPAAAPDPFASLRALAANLALVPGRGVTGSSPQLSIFGAGQNSPVVGLSTCRALKLIYAVDQPLSAPAVSLDGKKQLRFNAVGVTDGTSKTWQDFVTTQGATDPLTWDTLPNGQSWFFTGFLDIDRRSTGVVRCEGFWDEYDDSRPQQDKDGNYIFHPKPAQDTLFNIQNLPRDGDLQHLDLLTDENGNLRNVTYTFPSQYPKEKARRVRLRAVATSRYPHFFSNDPNLEKPTGTATLGDFEKESVSAQEAAAIDIMHAFTTVVWFKSSIRPKPIEIDCILPSFRWEVRHSEPGRRFSIERRAMLNVRLKGEWYRHGEGEKLGLICWPPDLFDDHPVDPAPNKEIESRVATLKENESFVTAWGSDAIWLSGVNEQLIPASSIHGYDATLKPAKVLLPPPEGKPPAPLPLPDTKKRAVVVVPFEPILNPTYGYRECKIGIDPGLNYSPTVRLGLVRYQPNSIKDFEISQPLAETVPVPPTRYLIVDVLDGGKTIQLTLYGQGFHRTATPQLDGKVEVNQPLLNIRLRRASVDGAIPVGPEETISWKPVLDKTHCPIDALNLPPTLNDPVKGEVVWSYSVHLPTYRREVHYGIELDEIIMMAADAPDGRGTVLVASAPVFSYTVDLWREPPLPGGVGGPKALAADGVPEGTYQILTPNEWRGKKQ